MDKYLRFKDEAEANSVLYTQEPTEWDNTDPENPVATAWEPRPNYANIDTIGIIYEGGEWDDEGEVKVAPVALDGWHVNVRVVDEDAGVLTPFQVTPQNPVRVWA